jgi:cytochrome c peroxidase
MRHYLVKLNLDISLFYFFGVSSKNNRFIKAIIPYSIFTDESGGYPLKDPSQDGKMKVPTLRNVDKRPNNGFKKAYAHNGYFKSLEEIVHFYNTRDVPGADWNGKPWPSAEVPENVNTAELGNLGLTKQEEKNIVAFLGTLSDGYRSRP